MFSAVVWQGRSCRSTEEDELEKLLSEAETSELTGLARSTLRKGRMNPNFGLPFVRIGRKIMYRPEEVRNFVEAHLIGSPSSRPNLSRSI